MTRATGRLRRVASILVAGAAPLFVPAPAIRAQDPAPLPAFVVAHPDDWQLFMGDVAFEQVASGTRVVFVYLTSGGADQPTPYWQARERGARASVYAAANAAESAPAEGVESSCAQVQVRGHRIQRCGHRNTVSYHFRLPDGNLDGSGFAVTQMQSMAKLRAGAMAHMAAVDSSTTYDGWNDLRETVRAVLADEATGAGPVALRLQCSDPDSTRNPGDHSDHVTAGRLVGEIAPSLEASVTRYAGYDIRNRPANLSVRAAMSKALVFMAYDRQRLLADGKWSAYAEDPPAYSAWLFRTYAQPEAR
jgi:hypothetical protein